MSRKDDMPKIINNSLKCITKLVESDTEIALIDLQILENLNTNQSLNYIKLEEKLTSLENNSQAAENSRNRIKQYSEKLDKLEEQVDSLGVIADEFDKWLKEVEIKIRLQKK